MDVMIKPFMIFLRVEFDGFSGPGLQWAINPVDSALGSYRNTTFGSGRWLSRGFSSKSTRATRSRITFELSVFLVVGAHDDPRREYSVGAREHLVARVAVLLPVLDRLIVDGAELPLLERVVVALGQSALLLGFRDVEIVFQNRDAAVGEELLE